MNHKILLLVLVSFLSSYSQIDKKFWFAAPDISELHADRPIYLRIATLDTKATVKVSIPATGLILDQFTLQPNSIRTSDLTTRINNIENGAYGFVSKKGILIESDQEITAYYEVRGISQWGPSNCDIYALKGSNALGTDFILPMQNYWISAKDAPDAYASFQIVATEDNTTVTITPTQDLSSHLKGITYSVTLNKGEVYTERALNTTNPTLRPTGTIVKSNKNIAITITDDSMFDNTTIALGAWDMGGDQIVPITKTGKEYVVNRISNENIGVDKIFITGIEDSTEIQINDSTKMLINRSQTKYYILDQKYNYVKASKHIYVLHIGGFDSELAAAILPPVICTGSKKVTLAVNSIDGAWLSIVVEKGGESSFIFDGKTNIIKASNFTELPYNKNYMCGKIDLSNITANSSKIIIANNNKSFQLALLNKEDRGTFTYGFFSDFGTLNLPDTLALCPNTATELNAGFGKDSYEWFKNGTPLNKDSSIISINSAGTYRVITYKGSCEFTDSTNVSIYNTDQTLFANDSISFCSNNRDTISTLKKYPTYSWQNGNKTQKIIDPPNGKYVLTVSDTNKCTIKDSIIVSTYPQTPLVVVFSAEEAYCNNSTCVSILANTGYQSYFNNDTLQTSNQICAQRTSDHRYRIKVVDAHGCIQTDSIKYECSPYIGAIPNIFTPKEQDGLNDHFSIPKLQEGYWELDVYNRYGIHVYHNENYNNTWDASNVSGGVYFYKLTHKFRDFSHKGWVEIR